MMRTNNSYSGRSILRALGVGQTEATFALQQIQIPPRSSDPDAGATVILVKAVQRGLNKLGADVPVTGSLDPMTRLCLAEVSGPLWEEVDWLETAKTIVNRIDAGWKLDSSDHEAVGATSLLASSYGMLAVAGGVVYLVMKYKK